MREIVSDTHYIVSENEWLLIPALLCFFFVVIMCVSLLPFSTFAEEVPVFGAIATSKVEDDLAKFGVDITKYQKDESATHCRMLKFLEYGYDFYGEQGSYGLYVYLWNPSGKEIQNTKNYIQMQAKA